MSKNLKVEAATQAADLPHRFESESGAVQSICDVCSATHADPRHLAWELAQREKANVNPESFPRETGL